ncbi:Amidohydrolase [Sulfidibacter corallicola]|uniref:Amidohydrolase n=2 Tax=Sulfidibacter corallicola TaxID=2818388 RepID=A0A8A4TNZ5_SULCO|nr:amidohydrolase family protein [Sulfidibacter corallicola]QTD51270.1 amidohydrolase [Sulfidibacter corallicola]
MSPMSNGSEPTSIIDVWMQHPNVQFFNHPMLASLRRWAGADKIEQTPPVSATLAAMDHGGVRFGLLSAWWGPNGPLIGNDEVADAIAQAPDRFGGLAAVDLFRPMEAVRELRRRVREQGFLGLRIVQWLWRLPATDRRYYPLFAECVELGVPVCLQVGHTGPLMPSETGRPIPYIDEVALDFPELKIVCGHIGYPWTTEMIAVATKHENVFIDTSAYTVARYPAELVAYLEHHGRHKVLFGSNFPMITPQKCLKGLDALGLDRNTRDAFLHGNARRVFGLPDSVGAAPGGAVSDGAVSGAVNS